MQKQPEAPKIEFPCSDYLIKVVGNAHVEFKPFVASVLVKYDEKVTVESFSENPSKKGTFVSLTIRMHIEHEQHLRDLHAELSQSSMVKMVL